MSKKIFFSFILALCLNFISTQNVTDCVEMYLNKTIDIPCKYNSTCCFLRYTLYNNTFTKCKLKVNITENLCDNFGDTISYFYGSLDICDCYSNSFLVNLKKSFGSVGLYITFFLFIIL
jgi:hypothetical protein